MMKVLKKLRLRPEEWREVHDRRDPLSLVGDSLEYRLMRAMLRRPL